MRSFEGCVLALESRVKILAAKKNSLAAIIKIIAAIIFGTYILVDTSLQKSPGFAESVGREESFS